MPTPSAALGAALPAAPSTHQWERPTKETAADQALTPRSSLAVPLSHIKHVCRPDDAHIPVLLEPQQIIVLADDEFRTGLVGTFQNAVVRLILRDAQGFFGLNDAPDFLKPLPRREQIIGWPVELLPQHADGLRDDRLADRYFDLAVDSHVK